MASGECTKSGTRLWCFITTAVFGILVLGLGLAMNNLDIRPELFGETILSGCATFLGVTTGLGMMHQGLTNANFGMGMRIGLMSNGSIITSASIILFMVNVLS